MQKIGHVASIASLCQTAVNKSGFVGVIFGSVWRHLMSSLLASFPFNSLPFVVSPQLRLNRPTLTSAKRAHGT